MCDDERKQELQRQAAVAACGMGREERARRRQAWRARVADLAEGIGRVYANDVGRPLGVRLRAYWEFGAWLRQAEEAAAGQRECGNLLVGDGVGGERCGIITSSQVDLAAIGAVLERVMALMDDNPGAEIVVSVRRGGDSSTLDKLAGRNLYNGS